MQGGAEGTEERVLTLRQFLVSQQQRRINYMPPRLFTGMTCTRRKEKRDEERGKERERDRERKRKRNRKRKRMRKRQVFGPS